MRVLDDESDDDSMEINILPMIDVIFAILSFFIVSTLFLTRFEGLPVNLPSSETAEPQPEATFTITLDKDGQLYLNRQEIQIETLRSIIQQQINPGQGAIVVIHGDEEADYGQVIKVMDQVRLIEGARLGMATRPGDS
ncbi:MAG: biopolymer transporter ExbD [Synechococcales bacterium]|nr:biopolymer transporter ExbD [Synechococcales bacterium]